MNIVGIYKVIYTNFGTNKKQKLSVKCVEKKIRDVILNIKKP